MSRNVWNYSEGRRSDKILSRISKEIDDRYNSENNEYEDR